MHRIVRTAVAALGLVVLPLATNAAKGCEAEKPAPKPTPKPVYAGDGVTQFTDSGRLQFGKAYKAHYVDTTDRVNCQWSLYTINSDGDTTVIKKGGYLTASIKVEKPTRVKVFLKSSECGDWKP